MWTEDKLLIVDKNGEVDEKDLSEISKRSIWKMKPPLSQEEIFIQC